VPQAHACQLKVIVITNKLDKPKIGAWSHGLEGLLANLHYRTRRSARNLLRQDQVQKHLRNPKGAV
jgi:hypothetical protein